jgi:hypothetical protein
MFSQLIENNDKFPGQEEYEVTTRKPSLAAAPIGAAKAANPAKQLTGTSSSQDLFPGEEEKLPGHNEFGGKQFGSASNGRSFSPPRF